MGVQPKAPLTGLVSATRCVGPAALAPSHVLLFTVSVRWHVLAEQASGGRWPPAPRSDTAPELKETKATWRVVVREVHPGQRRTCRVLPGMCLRPQQLHSTGQREGRGQKGSAAQQPGDVAAPRVSAQRVRVERELSLRAQRQAGLRGWAGLGRGSQLCPAHPVLLGPGSGPAGGAATPPKEPSLVHPWPHRVPFPGRDSVPRHPALVPRGRDTAGTRDTQIWGQPLTLSSSKLMRPSSSVSRSSCSSTTRARSSVGAARGRSRLSTRSRGDCRAQLGLVSCCSRLSLCFLAKFTNTWGGKGRRL